MGFAANQARLLALIARNSDLQLEMQFVNQRRMALGNMISGVMDLQSNLAPDSQASKVLDAKIRQLQQADKLLEMHLNTVTSQQKAVDTQIDGVKQLIDKNIQRSFSYGGGR